jgi:hypothetical protein
LFWRSSSENTTENLNEILGCENREAEKKQSPCHDRGISTNLRRTGIAVEAEVTCPKLAGASAFFSFPSTLVDLFRLSA